MNIRSAVRRGLSTAILLTCSTLAALLLAEVLVRVVAPQRLESHRPIYESDPLLVYRLKKNYSAVYRQPEFEIAEATNELGLRDHPIGPKRAGTLRILGLGDSFSYSNSVNLGETFFKQLERCLDAGAPAEVINAAVPAYSTLQEYRYLERDGVALAPDVVVLGYYVGNDFQDSWELLDSLGRPTIDVVDGQLQANDRFPSARYDQQERVLRTATMSLRSFFASNSALYVFLRERFSESLWRLGLRNNPPPPDFCARTFSPSMEAGWATTRSYLEKFVSLTSSRGIRLILVALPTQYQVHEELWKHHFTTFGLDPRQYDLDKPQELLRAFCAGHGIDYVDVLPAMRARAPGAHLFYPIASYMTPDGHRLVAEELCKYLRDHPGAGAVR
jgi:hypothetical protein